MIEYEGKVTLKKIYNNGSAPEEIVVHNTGRFALFEFIVNALAGDFERNLIPGYITQTHQTEESAVTPTAIMESLRYPVTSKRVSTGENASLSLSFNIVGDDAQNYLKAQDGKSIFLTLLSENQNNILAVTKLDASSVSGSPGSIIITWELEFNNSTEAANISLAAIKSPMALQRVNSSLKKATIRRMV